MELTVIQERIFEIRGQKVMLDYDLAALYDVETALNQAVKRNQKRFPDDFMFRLSAAEWEAIQQMNSSQFVMSSGKHRGARYQPYAFTEHGVTMLASVLKSEKAVEMNILIVRAFIHLRRFALQYRDLSEQIQALKEQLGSHDIQLGRIYDTIERMLDDQTELKSWQKREPIGFKPPKK
ncbi:ORF6N domain-containing protein [Taibaiella helva]|uniref:ORF6N domain-containing protein n=1 Tax=Taibaiella helva TaxID=2301235 RepID=UPI000E56805E|nr:ORF6N domain-containing protein [Taibaiella helva]